MQPNGSVLNEFLVEAKEHLEAIEQDLLALGRDGAPARDEVIHRVFRAVHTIKGNAGFFGFKRTSSVSHAMESVLALARTRRVALTPPQVDALLHGVDVLRLLLDNAEQGEGHDISAALDRLAGLAQPYSTATHEPPAAAPPAPAPPAAALPAAALPAAALPAAALPAAAPPAPVLPAAAPPAPALPAAAPAQSPAAPPVAAPVPRSAVAMPPAEVAGPECRDDDSQAFTCADPTPTPVDPQTFAAADPPPTPLDSQASANTDPTPTGLGSVRVRLDLLDHLMMLAGELVLVRNQHLQHLDRSNPTARAIGQRLDVVTADLQETIMRTRMQPIGNVFSKFSRIVHDLAAHLGKSIALDISGAQVELDKTILELLTDPLTHVIRNCCDHGIETPEVRRAAGKPETGRITLTAHHQGGQIMVEIRDDGRGIAVEALRAKAEAAGVKTAAELARMGHNELLSLAFLPGLSTTDRVSDVSGRGVGMDVVKTAVERLGGVVELRSQRGRGTELVLRMPLTLAIVPSLIVTSGGERFAIPQVNVEELVRLYDADVHDRIECAGHHEVHRLRGRLLPIAHLREILQRPSPFDPETQAEITEASRRTRLQGWQAAQQRMQQGDASDCAITFAVLKAGTTRYGLVVDDVLGAQEIVVKPMHRCVKHLGIYAGATVLGDGQVALILDALGLARHARIEFEGEPDAAAAHAQTRTETRSLLLFAGGVDEHFGVDLHSVRRIERIASRSIERTAGQEYVTVEGRATAIVRLDQMLPVSPTPAQDELFLILTKQDPPRGILASRVIDAGMHDLLLDRASVQLPGVQGTVIQRGRMTLLLDLDVIGRPPATHGGQA